MEKEMDTKELNKEIKNLEIAFEKEFQELNIMIKEEVGEQNIHYFRIQLISELIEKDVQSLINLFNYVLKLSNETKKLLDDTTELQDDFIKKHGIISIDEKIDPLSQIVKDVNMLDDNSKRRLMYYVSGYASGSSKK